MVTAKTASPASPSVESRRLPRTHYTPELVRTAAICVSQPAIPLRSVLVWCSPETGKVHRDEDFIIGIESVVQDKYEAPEKPIAPVDDLDKKYGPDGFTPKDLRDAGYKPTSEYFTNENGRVTHSVLVWDFESSSIVRLGSDLGMGIAYTEGPNYQRVVGPKDAPSDWWAKELKQAEEEVLERTAARNRSAR